ncbi:MAG: hypothetical protein OEX01_03770 [Candidatus Bathyarchaeota archaeon]|nr:hypothetical protein [Candidatus Bathyarchaeota archaeon]
MRTPPNFASIFFLTFSFLGLILIAAFANLPPAIQGDVSWRKPLIGTVFSIVCVLGILAGVFPSKCSGMFHFRKAKRGEFTRESTGLPKKTLTFRGHHPDCGNFGAHAFRIGDRVFCAGCAGLILGAALSLLGVVPYFFLNLSSWLNYFLVFWIGFVGVSCGLLQYHLFNWGKSSVHFSVNTFFVFSVFLLLVGVDGITQNVIADFYLIALGIFWLYTRILLSQLDHKIICTACHMKECEFHKGKSVKNGYYLRLIP